MCALDAAYVSHLFDERYVARVVGAARGDAAAGRLASRQFGVVATRQLHLAGLSPWQVSRRIGSLLHPVHRGVHRVGHTAPVPGGAEMAAVLAAGPTAALSHASGARWRDLVQKQPLRIHVTVTRQSRSRPGITIHRSTTRTARDVHLHHGIPTASPAWLLFDLDGRALERATGVAAARGLVDESSLRDVARRRRSNKLDLVLRALRGPTITRSEAEERLLDLVRRADLPRPEVNARVGELEVDFLWRDKNLVVEIDGWAFHSDRDAFEEDRRRDAYLGRRGLRVLRITWRRLVDEELAVVVDLAVATA